MTAKKILFTLGFTLAGIFITFLSAMAACTIGITSMNYGVYDVFSSADLEFTGSVTYTCDTTTNITIALGRGGAPSFNPRQMVEGADTLDYNLYLDAAHTTIWGDGTGGTSVYSDPSMPVNKPVTVTIYGRIPARQNVRAGTYTGTVTAIINF